MTGAVCDHFAHVLYHIVIAQAIRGVCNGHDARDHGSSPAKDKMCCRSAKARRLYRDSIVTQIRNRVCRVLDFDLFPSPSRASSHRTPATAQFWSQSHILPHISRFGPTHLSASRVSVHLQKSREESRKVSTRRSSVPLSSLHRSHEANLNHVN